MVRARERVGRDRGGVRLRSSEPPASGGIAASSAREATARACGKFAVMPEKPRFGVLVAVGLVSAVVLALQIVFTRLMSAVVSYHFSFLAISLALLGTGVGSLIIYIRPDWFERVELERTLARWTVAFGLLLVVLPLVVVHLRLDDGDGVTTFFALNLAAACLIVAVTAVAAGIVIALAIRGFAGSVGRVYAFDLVGAALGSLLVVPLLRWPAPNLVVALGGAAALGALLFAGKAQRERLGGLITLGLAVVVLVVGAFSGVLYLPSHYPHPANAPSSPDRWGPLARVRGYEFPGQNRPSGAVFYERIWAPVYGPVDGELPDWEHMLTGPESIGYLLKPNANALVIGGGGGRDIYTALSGGASHVDVIELNDTIRQVVDEDLGAVSGHPYSREGVDTSIGDGRSVLAHRDTKYDLISIGFTDTLSANAAAGFALSENNLYTTEAFDEYFDHLAPGGVLKVSRLDKLVGDEAIRVTVLTLAALEERGIEHPERNIVVVRGVDVFNETYGTVFARLTPWTEEEVAQIGKLADERALGIAFAAGGPYQDAWQELADAGHWKKFCNSYRLNVCPPTDDKPFFFNMRRVSQIGASRPPGYRYSIDPTDMLLLTLGMLAVLSVLGFVFPLFFRRTGERPKLTSLVYFLALGLGFLVLEIVFIQRFVLFLGFPTYALSVVLFSLLLFTGFGAYLSTRLPHGRTTLVAALAAVVGLIVVSAFALQPLLRSMIGLPFAARVLVSILVIAPLATLLGIPMPMGLDRLRALCADGVPWAWGVNGIASVLASVLGVAIAIFYGFKIATLVAAAFYALALGHALLGRWAPAASEAQGEEREEARIEAAAPVATS